MIGFLPKFQRKLRINCVQIKHFQPVTDFSMTHQTHQPHSSYQPASDAVNKDTYDVNAETECTVHTAEATITARKHAENSQTTPPAHSTATSPQGTT